LSHTSRYDFFKAFGTCRANKLLIGMRLAEHLIGINPRDMNSTTKPELQENVTHYEDELSSEMLKLGSRSRELVTKALVIGGSVALAYVVYRQLTGKKKSGILNIVMMGVASAMATGKGKDLLIAGKEKLTEYLRKEE